MALIEQAIQEVLSQEQLIPNAADNLRFKRNYRQNLKPNKWKFLYRLNNLR